MLQAKCSIPLLRYFHVTDFVCSVGAVFEIKTNPTPQQPANFRPPKHNIPDAVYTMCLLSFPCGLAFNMMLTTFLKRPVHPEYRSKCLLDI